MCFRRLLFLVLLLISGNIVSAATFTVTSNADSGPGTLRQALTDAAANGTTTIDYINFNLPTPTHTQADVTISVKTSLPIVSANIIIDGTTQPSLALGVSNAKVIITTETPAVGLNCFEVDGNATSNDAVEIYGLYILNFSPNPNQFGNGIVVNSNCKLVIGAPGKGNVITGNWYAVIGYLGGGKIQSNFFGLEPDGVTQNINFAGIFSSINYDNLLIGGSTAVEGNVIEMGASQTLAFGGVVDNPVNKTVIIENNLFNTDYTGNVALRVVNNPFISNADKQTTLDVYNNVFCAGALGIYGNRGTINVKGNFFGINRTQSVQLGNAGKAISIDDEVTANIGGNAAMDQNVFAHYTNPVTGSGHATLNVIQNKFYCNDYVNTENFTGVNFIRITNLTNTNVAGDTKPGATVQLYYTDAPNCSNCNPTTFFASVIAGTNGKWSYNGAIRSNVLASSTLANNTIGFQNFTITPADVTIKNIDCSGLGSIKVNEARTGRLQYLWTDYFTGAVVATTQQASNLPEGNYNLTISETGTNCPLEYGTFFVLDNTPHAYGQDFQLNCGSPTGSLTAVYDTGQGITVDKIFWENAAGVVISNAPEIDNLTAGDYYLYIKDSNGCTSAKVRCRVLPPVGQPTIIQTNVTVTNASCDFSNGAIKGMTLQNAGGANYGWVNAATLASYPMVLDLVGVPSGQYYFYVNYSFTCDQLKSKVYTVTGINAITLNETGEISTPSTCNNSNGSIKGITATGATQYQWYKADNTPIGGNAADLLNVPAGDYHLITSNSSCSKTSQTYTVANTPAVSTFPSTLAGSNAYCGMPNGSLTVTFADSGPASYRWQTPAGIHLIANATLTAGAGNYQLYVTDANGCESLYGTYVINDTPALQIVPGNEQFVNDQCGTGTGSIKNITVLGGAAPYTYTWTNASLSVVSTTANLVNVPAGEYTLTVKDALTCDVATRTYGITDDKSTIPAPAADNVQVCGAGDVVIKVNDPQAGYSYRLYSSISDGTVLADNTTGIFHLSVSGSISVYVTQCNGECESARDEVKIIVSSTSVSVPNTFTPNNDGKNDYWNIGGIENYPKATVRVFNRYGQKVFESRGYAQPFDGRQGSADLPVGVYYYIVDLSANCTLLSGSLTILR